MTAIRFPFLALCLIAVSGCQRSERRDADTTNDSTSSPVLVALDTTGGANVDAPSRTTQPPAPNPQIPPAPPQPLSVPLPDTARGVVRLVGNDPMTAVTLSRGNDTELLSLSGSSRELLRNVTGTEVVVIGRQTSDRDMLASPRGAPRFLVDSFIVRASDGTPATDGVLHQAGNRFHLRVSDSQRFTIAVLPDALREHVGARIYIVGSVERPTAWGIIRAR